MNIPKACELATKAILKAYAGYDADVAVRMFHDLTEDPNWKPNPERGAPVVGIAFAPESVNEDQATMQCEGVVNVETKTDDDRDHKAFSALYEKTHDALRDVFSEFMAGATGAKWLAFKAAFDAAAGTGAHLGGVTFGAPVPPDSSDGYNSVGIGWTIHFAYV
jgi:hypothetical protein